MAHLRRYGAAASSHPSLAGPMGCNERLELSTWLDGGAW